MQKVIILDSIRAVSFFLQKWPDHLSSQPARRWKSWQICLKSSLWISFSWQRICAVFSSCIFRSCHRPRASNSYRFAYKQWRALHELYCYCYRLYTSYTGIVAGFTQSLRGLIMRNIPLYLDCILCRWTRTGPGSVYNVYNRAYIAQHTVYNAQYTAYIAQHTAYIAQYTAYIAQHTVYIAQYTAYIHAEYCAQFYSSTVLQGSMRTLHNTQCTLYDTNFALHSAQGTVRSVQCTVHSAKCTVYWS